MLMSQTDAPRLLSGPPASTKFSAWLPLKSHRPHDRIFTEGANELRLESICVSGGNAWVKVDQ